MKYGNSISASVIAIVFSALFTALLLNGHLNQITYGSMMVANGVIAFAIFGFPRLRELDMKAGRLVLAEVRQIYGEILAKHADLKDLAEFSVELTALVTSGDLHYRLPVSSVDKVLCREKQRIIARDRGLALFARLGAPAHTIARICQAYDDPVRQAITHLMCFSIYRCVHASEKRIAGQANDAHIRVPESQVTGAQELAQNPSVVQAQRKELLQTSLTKSLFPLYFGPEGSRTKLKQRLDPLGLWTTELNSSLDELESLLMKAGISPVDYVPADDSNVLYTGI